MADHLLYAAFGKAVDSCMEKDESIVMVTSDTARDLCVYDLRDKYPGRVLDAGIAEQHAVSMASGLALSGMKPIVATYARFLTRAYEQIYNQLTERTQVVYVGSLAGPLPPEGPGISHEAREDGALFGVCLGMKVWLPDPENVAEWLRVALALGKSSYMRLRHSQ